MSEKRPCGPWEGTFNHLVPQDFAPACRVHDEDYTSNPRALTRAEADRRFLARMLELADGKPLAVLMAWAFYAAVRVGGGRYWRGGEGEQ